MASILNDSDIKRLLGSVIVDGEATSIRPNSYILRLGGDGEFLNAKKPFKLGGDSGKKGIRIAPGNSVALTAHELIDFTQPTVEKIFPGCALHGIISPSTDLSREGLVAATTQVDAGYKGTLNWTITNTSNEERRFTFKERLFRFSILRLEKGEVPLKFYDGDYQGQTGYVRSHRKGAPVGMRDHEWADSHVEGGPEELLDSLMKSGYPWHALGQRLKTIGEEIKIVTGEYAEIHETLDKLKTDVARIATRQDDSTTTLQKAINSAIIEQASHFQNRWLLASGSMLLATCGLVLSVASSDKSLNFLRANGALVGTLMVLAGIVVTVLVARSPRTKKRQE